MHRGLVSFGVWGTGGVERSEEDRASSSQPWRLGLERLKLDQGHGRTVWNATGTLEWLESFATQGPDALEILSVLLTRTRVNSSAMRSPTLRPSHMAHMAWPPCRRCPGPENQNTGSGDHLRPSLCIGYLWSPTSPAECDRAAWCGLGRTWLRDFPAPSPSRPSQLAVSRTQVCECTKNLC